jgi:hypothetical protein
MRRCLAVVLGLVTVVAGCETAKTEVAAPHFAAAGPFAGAAGADVVQIDVAVVERPLGDAFLNRGLWDLADEQAVSLESKPKLDDNGLRVCEIGGLPPAGLQALLSSPRSCPDPRRIQVHAGSPVPVPLGAAGRRCGFQLRQDGERRDVDLKDAQCVLEVVPTLTDDGKVHLQFMPKVKQGSPALRIAARQDPSGALRWDRREEQPEECFTRLAWDVTVAPNEFVVVGTHLNRPDTLGQTFFMALEEEPRLQRLLVVRTSRSLAEQAPAETPTGFAPPLALRAGLATVRGKDD